MNAMESPYNDSLCHHLFVTKKGYAMSYHGFNPRRPEFESTKVNRGDELLKVLTGTGRFVIRTNTDRRIAMDTKDLIYPTTASRDLTEWRRLGCLKSGEEVTWVGWVGRPFMVGGKS